MKPFWKEFCLAGLMGFVLPAAVLSAAVAIKRRPPQVWETEPPQTYREEADMGTVQTLLPVLTADGTVEMAVDDYLTGVVLAEMPSSFEPEALKAQAVVARTYAVRAHMRGSKHANAAVCTDSACCQGYIAPEDYIAGGGTQAGVEKICSAVAATSGYVLTFDGELIEATYFSCSGGSTEDAVAVWGTDVPYLRATSSPGEEGAAHFTDTVTYSAEKFETLLSLTLRGSPQTWLGPVTYTAGGGINTMTIGGTEFSGTELRKLLGLRSTAFTMTAGEDSVTVTTRGYGHRVGMSQYGADAMAATGSDYAAILAHYYQGTTLVLWDET